MFFWGGGLIFLSTRPNLRNEIWTLKFGGRFFFFRRVWFHRPPTVGRVVLLISLPSKEAMNGFWVTWSPSWEDPVGKTLLHELKGLRGLRGSGATTQTVFWIGINWVFTKDGTLGFFDIRRQCHQSVLFVVLFFLLLFAVAWGHCWERCGRLFEGCV